MQLNLNFWPCLLKYPCCIFNLMLINIFSVIFRLANIEIKKRINSLSWIWRTTVYRSWSPRSRMGGVQRKWWSGTARWTRWDWRNSNSGDSTLNYRARWDDQGILSKVGHGSRFFFNHFLWHVQPLKFLFITENQIIKKEIKKFSLKVSVSSRFIFQRYM